MPDTRPVWLTREQVMWLMSLPHNMGIVAAWKAAPADATKAVSDAIRDYHGNVMLPYDILRALGWPDPDA